MYIMKKYRTLLGEIRDDIKMEIHPMFMGWRPTYC